jgi:hypothetical protein
LIESGEKVANPSFRCRFAVNAILPDIDDSKSATDYLKIFDTKSGLTRDFTTQKLKPSEKLCIFVQLLCKDPSLQFSNDFVRLNLYQDEKDGFFKGVSPSDLSSNKKEQLKFLSALKTILRFNSYLHATVEMQEEGKNKIFTIAKDT